MFRPSCAASSRPQPSCSPSSRPLPRGRARPRTRCAAPWRARCAPPGRSSGALRGRPGQRPHACSRCAPTRPAFPPPTRSSSPRPPRSSASARPARLTTRVLGDGELRGRRHLRRRPLPARRRRPDVRHRDVQPPRLRRAAPRSPSSSGAWRRRDRAGQRRRVRRRVAASTACRGGPRSGFGVSTPTSAAPLSGARLQPRPREPRRHGASSAGPAASPPPSSRGPCAPPACRCAGRVGERRRARRARALVTSVPSPPMSTLIAAHQPAVGQLLRRDAAQGARRALRRAAARPQAGAAVVRGRARRPGRAAAHRRRLGPVARRPHHPAHGRAPARPAATARRTLAAPFRNSLGVAGRERDAGRAHARHVRRAAAAGGRPARCPTSGAVGLLRLPDRP